MSTTTYMDDVTQQDGLDDWDSAPDAGHAQIVHGGHDPLSGLASLAMVANQLGTRDERRIAAEAKRLGQRMGRHAFYSWRAAGSTVEGPTIQLAYALQSVWGRIQSKVAIVDEQPDRLQMEAMVIDLLTVTATSRPFTAHLAPPPGKFANKADQAERWRTMQMQSAVSKAVRGVILATIPRWVTETALDAAKEAASNRILRGRSVAEAVKDAIGALGQHGFTEQDLETLIGRPSSQWAIAELETIVDWIRQVKSGDVTWETLRAEIDGKGDGAGGAAPSVPWTPKTNTGDAATGASPEQAAEGPPVPDGGIPLADVGRLKRDVAANVYQLAAEAGPGSFRAAIERLGLPANVAGWPEKAWANVAAAITEQLGKGEE